MSRLLSPPYTVNPLVAAAFLARIKIRYRRWRFEPRMRQALCGSIDYSDLEALIQAIAGIYDGQWPPRLLLCTYTRRATLQALDTLLRRYGVAK